ASSTSASAEGLRERAPARSPKAGREDSTSPLASRNAASEGKMSSRRQVSSTAGTGTITGLRGGGLLVPEVGVEPTRPQGSGDFESPASAIPPLRRGGSGA